MTGGPASAHLSEEELARDFDLLILDFAGVCTPTHGEYLRALAAGTADAMIADPIRPGCLELACRAQQNGIVVAVLSNDLDMNWIPSVPLLQQVDHVISCADNGIVKPDRRAYQRVLLLTGCAAERTLFVDDDPHNVAGARAVNIQAMLFDASDPNRCWADIAELLQLD